MIIFLTSPFIRYRCKAKRQRFRIAAALLGLSIKRPNRTVKRIVKDIAKLADVLGYSSKDTTRIYIISTGYVICEDIIDSQAFNNEYYTNGTTDSYGGIANYNDTTYSHLANDWSSSAIRTWLNETFFVTAFSLSERSQIPSTVLPLRHIQHHIQNTT